MTAPDIDSLATYGGEKEDYSPVEDPTTDRAAADANQAYATVAALTHTAPRAILRFTGAATPTLVSHDSMWGNAFADSPTIVNGATGIYTITWPATVQDELGESHSPNFRYAHAQSNGTSIANHCQCFVAANTVAVAVYDMAGVADNAYGASFEVFVY
jgi:hypothetical protein